MAHDVVLRWWVSSRGCRKPIDGIFLAAAMTIIGLSVNDTVVVFDRIRERWFAVASRGSFFAKIANRGRPYETMPRTVNTGLGTMFILAALAVLGGDSLRDFAIALLVGLDRRHLRPSRLHRHPDAHLLPAEVADGSDEAREGRALRRTTPAQSSEPSEV